MSHTPQPTLRCSAAASRRRSLTPSPPSRLTLPELNSNSHTNHHHPNGVGATSSNSGSKFLTPFVHRTAPLARGGSSNNANITYNSTSTATPLNNNHHGSGHSNSTTNSISGSSSKIGGNPSPLLLTSALASLTSSTGSNGKSSHQHLPNSISSSSVTNALHQSFLDTSLGSFGISVSMCSTPNCSTPISHHNGSFRRGSCGATPSTPSATPSSAVAADEALMAESIDYTRLVCPIKLQEVTAKPRNVSPFDSQKYYSLLPPPTSENSGRVALALDIDETLVHAVSVPAMTTARVGTVLRFSAEHARTLFNESSSSLPSFSSVSHHQQHAATSKAAALPVAGMDTTAMLQRYRANSDFVVHIAKGLPNEEMVFVKYRPHVHEFLAFAIRNFEVIFFTASRACYADPLLDELLREASKLGCDASSVQRLRLYREHCAEVGGSKVKDLSLLGRPLHRIALVDNLASSFMFQPRNGVHIKSWYGEAHDTELRTMQHMLGHLAATTDVLHVLDKYNSALTQLVVSPVRTPMALHA
ncbi:NLI interacting factor-like phosphatase, putative [Bodo saltans]|uniref:Mitochondrial import inner membrane translocase subunit TIM50 n=1 Tax=Bodo saltans TaxID=75058 RepID=A0A0S4JTH7_BODSA|nr:NLI interacting factor-like phosphatase, putative [Bodo saltans]|eukprot:CUG92713.1 NLI interacting factor-like phosphatase, putative [Bodo saltans]